VLSIDGDLSSAAETAKGAVAGALRVQVVLVVRF
jgi:hypothetical protein